MNKHSDHQSTRSGWMYRIMAIGLIALSGTVTVAQGSISSLIILQQQIGLNGLTATLQLSGDTDSTVGGQPGYNPVPNETFHYVLAISEVSGNPSMAYTLDVFSADITFGTTTGAGWACSPLTGGLTCSGPALVAGGSTTLDIQAVAPPNPQQLQVDVFLNPNTPDIALGSPLTINTSTGVGLQSNLISGDTNGLAGQLLNYTFSMSNVDRVGTPVDGSRAVSPKLVLNATDDTGMDLALAGSSGSEWSCSQISPMFVECDYTGTQLDDPGMTTPNVIVSYTAPAVDSPDNVTIIADPFATNIDLMSGQETVVNTMIEPASDLSIVANTGVTTTTVGDTFNYILSATNNGPSATTDIVVSNTLPPEVSFISVTAGEFNCLESVGVVDCTYMAGPVSAGMSAADIVISVQADTAGTANNTAIIMSSVVTDINAANDTDTASLVIDPPAPVGGVDMRIFKRSLQQQVDGGASINYQITVQNIGNLPASGVQIEDTLPDGTSLLSVSAVNWDCSESDGVVTCDYLPPVLNRGISALVILEVAAPNMSGLIFNTATVDSTETDDDTTNNRARAVTRINAVAGADLQLIKTVSNTVLSQGEAFQYDFNIINSGPEIAEGLTLIDQLPLGIDFVSAAGMGWICTQSGNQILCDFSETLDIGASTSLSFSVTAPLDEGSFTNQAQVDAITPDPDSSNNVANVTIMVGQSEASADIVLSKSVDQETASTMDTLTYVLSASNTGPSTASGVRIIDSLPDGLILNGIDAPGWSCLTTSNMVDCELMNPLMIDQVASLTLMAVVQAQSGTVSNNASVTSQVPDPQPDNNNDSASTMILAAADPANLSVQLVDSADPVRINRSFGYQATVSNGGPAVAEQIMLTLDLGSVSSIDSVSAAGWTCSTALPLINCRLNTSLVPGASASLVASVTAPADAGSVFAQAQVSAMTPDNDPADNVDDESTRISVTSDENSFSERLNDALGNSDDPGVTDNLDAIAALCGNPIAQVSQLCGEIDDALDDGRTGELANAIVSVIGRQTVTQHTSMTEASAVQFANINARFAENRGGSAGGFSMNGLNLRFGDNTLPVSFMQVDEDESAIGSSNLIRPWGFFVNGTISAGEKDASTRELGFEFDTYGLTAGFDYRPSSQSVFGVAIGYADFESDYNDGGALETDGLTLHTFASFYPTERFYIDGRLSYSSFDFTQFRPISFTLGGLTVDDIAVGDTEADQLSAALSFGLNINQGAWNFTPSGTVTVTDGTIDGFVEAGTDLALTYQEQDVESLLLTASFSASRVISLANGVLTPQFSVAYHHETQNDNFDVNSRIIGAVGNSTFFIDSDEPDVNYGSIGVGLIWVMSDGKQAYINYRNLVGLSRFDRWTINGGMRFEF